MVFWDFPLLLFHLTYLCSLELPTESSLKGSLKKTMSTLDETHDVVGFWTLTSFRILFLLLFSGFFLYERDWFPDSSVLRKSYFRKVDQWHISRSFLKWLVGAELGYSRLHHREGGGWSPMSVSLTPCLGTTGKDRISSVYKRSSVMRRREGSPTDNCIF